MSTTPNDTLDRLLGISAVEDLTGLHRATIGRKLKEGKFPKPTFVGELRKWRESEIRAWVAAQASRPASARRLAKNLGEHAGDKTSNTP